MKVTLQMGPSFARAADELGSMGRSLLDAASEGLGEAVKLAANKVSSDYISGQSLKVRTGSLRRAVDGWLESDFEGVVGVAEGSAVSKYAWLLGDEEKTITPKKGKFLTIPVGENLTGAGVARFISPRQVPDGFFVKTKGRLLFGYKRGKRGKFRPLFVLVKSVFVQGSGALADGVLDSLDGMAGAIEDSIARKIGTN
ncbi:MAG: hypothetical protein DRP65_00430 [Planctomycetota bacterium]|nr:MAG: hypothetical protein DRP65_00430 [Planctomycetota bacterium]